jgi:hypothetical protein
VAVNLGVLGWPKSWADLVEALLLCRGLSGDVDSGVFARELLESRKNEAVHNIEDVRSVKEVFKSWTEDERCLKQALK